MRTLSLAETRALVLAAQGLAGPRPPRATARSVTELIRRLGVLQLDYVNVLAPAHYQVAFTRLGSHAREVFDRAVYGSGACTEQWAHEASLVPVESWPLLEYRRTAHRLRPYGFEKILGKHPGYAQWVVEEIGRRGPLAAEDLPLPEGAPRRIPNAWAGSVPRAVLEAHFGRGVLAVARRRANFTREYDLAERLIPAAHHGRALATGEQVRELLRQAARSLGVATARDLGDYWRMPASLANPQVAALAAAGELEPVRVEGWREPAYLAPGVRFPARLTGATLVSPFDPLIWFRPRVARLFGFEYRVEIFVPAAQRRWGYYVLPFLLGDRLVARVDLKADRANRLLRVLAAHLEPEAKATEVAAALAAELAAWAEWLGLAEVRVEARSPLARGIRAAIRAA